MSLSATVSQIEPVHTPCAPIASAPAICDPCAMPPAASTGRRRDRFDHLGPEHHRADLAGVTAGFGALRDDDVDPDVDVLLRVPRAARERRDLDAALVRGVDDVLGRRPERVDEQRRRVLERDVDLRARGRVGPAEQMVTAGVVRAAAARRARRAPSRPTPGAPGLIICSSWPSRSSAFTPSGSWTLAGMTRSTP